MIDDDDGRDELRAAFTDHQRPPRDVVPHSHNVAHTVELLRTMAGTTAVVSHHELGPDGITTYTDRVEICAPITPEKGLHP